MRDYGDEDDGWRGSRITGQYKNAAVDGRADLLERVETFAANTGNIKARDLVRELAARIRHMEADMQKMREAIDTLTYMSER